MRESQFLFILNNINTRDNEPERREFCDEHDSRRFQNNPEKFDDVGVLDGLHDLVLLHELEHAVVKAVFAQALNRNLKRKLCYYLPLVSCFW